MICPFESGRHAPGVRDDGYDVRTPRRVEGHPVPVQIVDMQTRPAVSRPLPADPYTGEA